jgi:ribonuclease HII
MTAESMGYGFRIGADENGLGPRLGPMLTTAVLAEIGDGGHRTIERGARGKMSERLGDSKALMAHGDIALGEAWSRVLAARALGRAATSVSELVHALSLDDEGQLRAHCPPHVSGMCWGDRGDGFLADDALLSAVEKDLERLAKKGVRILTARSVIVCTLQLNRGVDRGLSRFALDLHAMERLVISMRETAGQDVCAVLGKVGGLRQYEPAFGPLNGRMCAVLEERKERSTYRFPGVGQLSFVMDADASDLLVSMASLVGKYLREVLMARIVHHYRQSDGSLPDASGYHDPITAQFVDATKLTRKKQKVPSDCFERRKLG